MDLESVAGKLGRRSKPPKPKRLAKKARLGEGSTTGSRRARPSTPASNNPYKERLKHQLRRRGVNRRSVRARARAALPVLGVCFLALGVLGGLAVVPARTWWSQRAEMSEAREQLAIMQAQVAELREDLDVLRTPQEIERLAKQDYGMVYPNEESYLIVDP